MNKILAYSICSIVFYSSLFFSCGNNETNMQLKNTFDKTEGYYAVIYRVFRREKQSNGNVKEIYFCGNVGTIAAPQLFAWGDCGLNGELDGSQPLKAAAAQASRKHFADLALKNSNFARYKDDWVKTAELFYADKKNFLGVPEYELVRVGWTFH